MVTGKREEKRRKLKDDILEAAIAQVRDGGLSQLRTRDIARKVGCALGAIYNVFADLDDLILHVNSQTLKTLGETMAAVSVDTADAPPDRQMVALAHAYLDFAVENHNAWTALFDHHLPEGRAVPDWHLNEQDVLFVYILRPLHLVMPQLSDTQAALTARGLFSAVHGIVSLSLERRFSAVPEPEIRDMLSLLIGTFARAAPSS